MPCSNDVTWCERIVAPSSPSIHPVAVHRHRGVYGGGCNQGMQVPAPAQHAFIGGLL